MALSCNATESLFQLGVAAFAQQASDDFSLVLRSNNTIIEFESFTAFDDVDYSKCLPNDGCYTVHVRKLDPDMVTLSWGGEELTGEQYPYIGDSNQTFAEFGNGCIPECNDDENLFELLFFQANLHRFHWRLEDAVGNEIVGCNERDCFNDFAATVLRSCVPKADCSRFLLGGSTVLSTSREDNPRFEVKMDGEIVAQEVDVDFRAVEIGTCSPCTNDESPFEFFMSRALSSPGDPPLTYKLVRANDDSAIFERTIEAPTNFSHSDYNFLQYVKQCVPSNDCYQFEVSVPDQSDSEDFYWENPHLQLTLNDVYWINGRYGFGGSFDPVYSFQTPMGKCDTGTLCDESEFFLEVTTETHADLIPFGGLEWFVVAVSSERRAETETFIGSRAFTNGLPGGSTFKELECFPNNETLTFGVLDRSLDGIKDWTVAKDSVPLECRIMANDDDLYGDFFAGSILTPLDGSCGDETKTSLAGGAIAGIVVGGVIACALAAFVYWRYQENHDSYSRGESCHSHQGHNCCR